jgi:hypothetical protein
MLIGIEDDLIAAVESLDEILVIIEQGAEAVTEATEQLDSATESVSQKVTEIQTKAQEWEGEYQHELIKRTENALATLPSQIPGNRQESLESVRTYIDPVRASLDDGILSHIELSNILFAGANASVGLLAHGGPQLKNFSGSINDITSQLATGQLKEVPNSLGSLE